MFVSTASRLIRISIAPILLQITGWSHRPCDMLPWPGGEMGTRKGRISRMNAEQGREWEKENETEMSGRGESNGELPQRQHTCFSVPRSSAKSALPASPSFHPVFSWPCPTAGTRAFLFRVRPRNAPFPRPLPSALFSVGPVQPPAHVLFCSAFVREMRPSRVPFLPPCFQLALSNRRHTCSSVPRSSAKSAFSASRSFRPLLSWPCPTAGTRAFLFRVRPRNPLFPRPLSFLLLSVGPFQPVVFDRALPLRQA